MSGPNCMVKHCTQYLTRDYWSTPVSFVHVEIFRCLACICTSTYSARVRSGLTLYLCKVPGYVLLRENEGENDTFNRELRRRGVFVSKCLRGGTDQLDLQEVEILYCNDYVVNLRFVDCGGWHYLPSCQFRNFVGRIYIQMVPAKSQMCSVQCFSPRS